MTTEVYGSISITELARIRGVMTETLRFYDRKGILKPSYVDPSNGRRYYSIVDCERLGTIRELQPQAGRAESADSGAPPPAQNHRPPQEQAQAGD